MIYQTWAFWLKKQKAKNVQDVGKSWETLAKDVAVY